MTFETVKEVVIDASPETIFPFLINEKEFVRWMGTDVSLNAVPGGKFHVVCGGLNPSLGEFLEVTPYSRVRFTFGWDIPDHPIPAGSSEVDITLVPSGSSTVLRLVHRGLPEDALTDHQRGWTYYLERLVIVVGGGDPGPDQPGV